MSELIYRDEAIKVVNDNEKIGTLSKWKIGWNSSLYYVRRKLEELPPVQRNGTWITDVNDDNNAYCSECGLLTTKDLLKRIALVCENKPKFCPNCGAKMEDRGGKN